MVLLINMSNGKHLPSLLLVIIPLSVAQQTISFVQDASAVLAPAHPHSGHAHLDSCSSSLMLRLFLAELLLQQVLPSLYRDMWNPGLLPELQELSMVQPPSLSISLPFFNYSGIQSSKGRLPFTVEGCTILRISMETQL